MSLPVPYQPAAPMQMADIAQVLIARSLSRDPNTEDLQRLGSAYVGVDVLERSSEARTRVTSRVNDEVERMLAMGYTLKSKEVQRLRTAEQTDYELFELIGRHSAENLRRR